MALPVRAGDGSGGGPALRGGQPGGTPKRQGVQGDPPQGPVLGGRDGGSTDPPRIQPH